MSGLDYFRQNYPEEFEGLNDYQAVGKIAERTGQSPDKVAEQFAITMPTIGGEFKKGLSRGIDSMQGSAYGLGALASHAVGAEGVRDWMMEGAERNQREGQAQAAAVGDMRNIGGIRDAGLWGAGILGDQAAQMPFSLTAAGAGMRIAGKKAIEAGLRQGLSRQAAERAAAAGSASTLGGYAGGAAYGAGMETGDNFLSIHEQSGEFQPLNAIAHGVPAGALEGLSDVALLKGVKGGIPAGVSRPAYVAKEFGKQAAISGGLEEAPQDLLAQHALMTADSEYEYDPWRTANAAAAGAVGGGTIGSAFAAVTPSQKMKAAVRDPVGSIIEGMKGRAEERGRKQAQDEIAGMEASMRERFGTREADFTGPLSEAEKAMDDATLSQHRRQMSVAEAKKILTSPPRSLGAREEEIRNEAARVVNEDGKNHETFRALLKEQKADAARQQMASEFDTPDSKASEMTPLGQEASDLANAWIANEGKNHSWVFDESDNGKLLSAKLFAWIKSDFGKELNDGEPIMPTSMLEELGDGAAKVVQSAITAARKEGWEVADAGDMIERIKGQSVNRSGDVSVLRNTLRYSQEKNWDDKSLQKFAKELRQRGGRMDKEDYKWLRSQFSDPAKVLEHFAKKSPYYKAPKQLEYPNKTIDPVISQSEKDPNPRTTPKLNDEGGEARYGQFIEERDFNETVGESGNEATPRSRSKYVLRQYIEEDGSRSRVDSFDILDKKANERLSETFEREKAAESETGGPVRVERVGMVDRALDEAELKANGPLTDAEKRQVVENLVLERRKDLERPGQLPEDASPLVKRMHADRVRMFDQEVDKAARGLNRRYLSVRRVELAADRLQGEIDIEAVNAAERRVRLSNAGNAPQNGTLVFTTKGGGHFIINAPQIMRLMFKQQNSFGDSGAVYADEDKNAIYAGGPQKLGDLLMEGVAAVLQHDKFTGVGYIVNGEVVPMDSKVSRLPDNFKIVGQTTWGDYKKSAKDFRSRTADTSKDYDPDDFDQRRGLRAKYDSTVAGDISRVRTLAKRAEKGGTFAADEQAKIDRFNKLSPDDRKALTRFMDRWYDEDDTEHKFRADGNARKALKAWADLLGVQFDEVHYNDGKGADGLDGQDRTDDSMEAYAPSRAIHRDERGVMTTEGDESPQTVIGTTRKPAAGEKSVGSALKATERDNPPLSAKQKAAEGAFQAMQADLVTMLRNSVDTALDAIGIMSLSDLDRTLAAFDQLYAMAVSKDGASPNLDTFAKNFVDGDVQKARLLATRIARSADRVHAKIAATKRATKEGALGASGQGQQPGELSPGWSRFPEKLGTNYEVSTAGDKRFSALNATLADGRTIEEAYQLDVKGYRKNGDNWRLGKGKPPLRKMSREELYAEYKALWTQWAQENPELMRELAEKSKGKVLTDKFASTEISQARALSELLSEKPDDLEAHQMSKQLDLSKVAPNTPVWSVYTAKDEDQAGSHIASFTDMGAAQWLAEKRGGTLVNELAKDAGAKYSEQNTGESDGQPSGSGLAGSEREGGAGDAFAGTGGIPGDGKAKRTGAFARRIADVSNAYLARLEKAKVGILHSTPLSAFSNYYTTAEFIPEMNAFAMLVMNDEGRAELAKFEAAAKAQGVPFTSQLKHRVMGYVSVARLTYDFADNSFTMLAADKGSVGEGILAKNNVLGETVDRTGRKLNKVEGVKLSELTNLLGEFHARLKLFNGGDAVEINWDRYTGANTEKTGSVTFSEQTTDPLNTPIDPVQAVKDLKQAFGDDFDAQVVEKGLGGKSGKWSEAGIKLAAAAPDGTQFHEALHQFFSLLRKHGAPNVVALIERVATNPLMVRKLSLMLDKHPKAVKQLKTPEEAAAFMYQFWQMGMLNVGPETRTLFEKIKALVTHGAKKLLSLVDTSYRDQYNTEKKQRLDQDAAMEALSVIMSGQLAKPDTREAILDALRKNVEAHDKALEQLGQTADRMWRSLGKVVISNEAMLKLFKQHPELQKMADKFHQIHGSAMTNQGRDGGPEARGGFLEASQQASGMWLNRLDKLMAGYSKEEIELAMPHLEAGTLPNDAKVAKMVNDVRDYLGSIYQEVIVDGDVRRLDITHPDRWVSIDKRADYFSQVWDTEAVMNNREGFITKLHELHQANLEHMAKQANAEIAAWKQKGTKPTSPSAQAELARAEKAALERGEAEGRALTRMDTQPVTPELVAEQIYTRLINSLGMIDMEESSWSMGITPGASAVNRRELNWLDKEAFSEFKSKDLVNILTTYTRTMTKRAEYQKRFGYGGEEISDAVDTALLRELGGEELLTSARDALDDEIKAWKKDAAAWHKDNPGEPYPEPFPTLRLVGVQMDALKDGHNERMIEAEKTLRPAINAIKAMEGTLGADISPALRSFSSWVTTYQNVRLLPFMLFTNISDVIGITAQGGTLGDAWDAFVTGIREIRNSWTKDQSADPTMRRGELWGVVDASAFLESLGQNWGSVYMNQRAKRINDKFFRMVGAEGWNRGIRASAAQVGERIVMNWVQNGLEKNKAGEKERFERLYGEGATPSSIKLDSAGNLDVNDAKNRAAINRFVHDAIMSSNAAHRTAWMSDPHFATFAHLKNFAYTFHRVMLLNIIDQAKLGNFRPALVAGLGYAPIAIAAGAIKEMLIPGDEPYWMKQGLGGYLEYGYMQANLGGVGQLYGEGLTDLDPAKLAGPFWDQIQNTLTSPLPGINVNLSPFDGDTEILRDRQWDVELAKALPAGNVVSRAFKD